MSDLPLIWCMVLTCLTSNKKKAFATSMHSSRRSLAVCLIKLETFFNQRSLGKALHNLARGGSAPSLAASANRLVTRTCAGTHITAFLCALAAGFRTSPTMLIVMFLAFCGARVANRGAEAAEFCAKSGISAHERRTGPAEIRAINT